MNPLAFALGALAGGFVLYVAFKWAIRSPTYAAIFVGSLAKNVGLAHWISVSDSWVVARCPRCSWIEKRSLGGEDNDV
jgi:hypothetical protein